MENNSLYILGTAQADREATEWHRKQYRESIAPFPGQYPFCVLLEKNVKEYGIEKGLERAKNIVLFEIQQHIAFGGGIYYFRDIYSHMSTPFRGSETVKEMATTMINKRALSVSELSKIVEEIAYNAKRTPLNPEHLEETYQKLKAAGNNIGDLRMVERFAWLPTRVNMGHGAIWLETYKEAEVFIGGGRWVKTGVKTYEPK